MSTNKPKTPKITNVYIDLRSHSIILKDEEHTVATYETDPFLVSLEFSVHVPDNALKSK